MDYRRFVPDAIPDDGPVETDMFELRPMMQSLSRHRNKLVLIDGLSNDQKLAGSGHSSAYAALSCVPNDPPSEIGGPGAETVDQYLARTMGSCALFPHLGLAVGKTSAARIATISANRNRRPVPMYCRPQDAYQYLFGPAFAQSGASVASRGALFDILRKDVARLRRNLGGQERLKLDEILSAVEAIERREAAVAARREFLQMCGPDQNAFSDETIEDALEGHFRIATSALICGLTRVATISSGCGYGFFDIPFRRLGLLSTKHQFGHGYDGGLDALDQIHNFHAELIAQMADRLSMIPEGDGTMLDHTLIVWTNENGGQHHSDYRRWPVVLLGGQAMGLRTGRYIRFPDQGLMGARTLADLWSTLTHLLGAPRDDFGAAGLEPSNGPIQNLVL